MGACGDIGKNVRRRVSVVGFEDDDRRFTHPPALETTPFSGDSTLTFWQDRIIIADGNAAPLVKTRTIEVSELMIGLPYLVVGGLPP